jgi:hypothetical protein
MPDAHMHRHGHRGLTLTFSTNPVSVLVANSSVSMIEQLPPEIFLLKIFSLLWRLGKFTVPIVRYQLTLVISSCLTAWWACRALSRLGGSLPFLAASPLWLRADPARSIPGCRCCPSFRQRLCPPARCPERKGWGAALLSARASRRRPHENRGSNTAAVVGAQVGHDEHMAGNDREGKPVCRALEVRGLVYVAAAR